MPTKTLAPTKSRQHILRDDLSRTHTRLVVNRALLRQSANTDLFPDHEDKLKREKIHNDLTDAMILLEQSLTLLKTIDGFNA